MKAIGHTAVDRHDFADYLELTLEPLESLLFGDNRSARAGFDHLQLDQDPLPETFFGAIGTYLARCCGLPSSGGSWPSTQLGRFDPELASRASISPHGEAETVELLGLGILSPEGQCWFPRPLHARFGRSRGSKEPSFGLDPLKPAPSSLRAASSCPFDRLLDGSEVLGEDDRELLVRQDLLADILAGDSPGDARQQVRTVGSIQRREGRPGIQIDPATGTVEEGHLFTRPYRALRPASSAARSERLGWAFRTWAATPFATSPIHLPTRLGFLGGDRRRVRIRSESLSCLPLVPLMSRVKSAAQSSSGFLLYFLTPAVGVDIKTLSVAGAVPIAGAIGRLVRASGWNVSRNRPRPLLEAIPAGSVLFFDWPAEGARESIIHSNWLRAFGYGGRVGYGRALVGVWR